MRKRTLAREIALKALYQWDLLGKEMEAQLPEFCRGEANDADVAAFALDLVAGCTENVKVLDEHIAAAAENWDISRMAVIDRTILRIGTFELAFRDDIPPKVTINEAIELAKRYSTESSGVFVNGILDKVRQRLGKAVDQGAQSESPLT
jgi:transcription antitermination factor NusB